MTVMTPLQCALARAGLDLPVRDAAEQALVGRNTIVRFENGTGVEPLSVQRLQTFFERAGVTFLPDDGTGEGVRIRKQAREDPGRP